MMAGKTSGNAANDRVLMQPFASAVGGADTSASDKAAHRNNRFRTPLPFPNPLWADCPVPG
jgi:hypothetical protein